MLSQAVEKVYIIFGKSNSVKVNCHLKGETQFWKDPIHIWNETHTDPKLLDDDEIMVT